MPRQKYFGDNMIIPEDALVGEEGQGFDIFCLV